MYKDIKKVTIHTNRSHLYNWALGIDYYTIYEDNMAMASVLQLSFIFFNITFTKWCY